MTDLEIVEGLRQGTPDAFRNLYAMHGRAVLTYLTRILGRKEMAEELTQETFLTVIRKIGFFREQADGGFKAWIYRIATHRAFDVLRREKRMVLSDEAGERVVSSEVGDFPNPERVLELRQFSVRLQTALGELTPAQRMAFLLLEQAGMTCLEISRVLGCSESAAKQGAYRARAALRKKLSSEDEP